MGEALEFHKMMNIIMSLDFVTSRPNPELVKRNMSYHFTSSYAYDMLETSPNISSNIFFGVRLSLINSQLLSSLIRNEIDAAWCLASCFLALDMTYALGRQLCCYRRMPVVQRSISSEASWLTFYRLSKVC